MAHLLSVGLLIARPGFNSRSRLHLFTCFLILLGPFVHGDRIFGDRLSSGTEYVGDHLSRGSIFGGPEVGDRKSGDQMGSGTIASQPW